MFSFEIFSPTLSIRIIPLKWNAKGKLSTELYVYSNGMLGVNDEIGRREIEGLRSLSGYCRSLGRRARDSLQLQ
jgi:hypothetical protein